VFIEVLETAGLCDDVGSVVTRVQVG